MTTFLFWNLNRKPLAERVANIAASHAVDVIILAECVVEPDSMVNALRQTTGRDYVLPYSECEKIAIYSGFPANQLQPVVDEERFTVRSLTLPNTPEVLLAAAHLPSKLHWSADSQSYECARMANVIRWIEQTRGHARTVLVGDLNMNPFETGIVSASGLHGIMTRDIAEKRERVVQGFLYPFFYNPMWSRMGDESIGPAGTYHDQRSEHVNFFWNTFDQVLLRPDLLPAFRNEDLRVLTDDGVASLITANGLPDDNMASDHLPICFTLHL